MRLESLRLVVPAAPGNGTAQLVRDLSNKYVQIGGGAFTGSLTIEVSLNGGVDFAQTGAAITAPGIVVVPEPATHVRVVTGSLSAGTPTATIAGHLRDD